MHTPKSSNGSDKNHNASCKRSNKKSKSKEKSGTASIRILKLINAMVGSEKSLTRAESSRANQELMFGDIEINASKLVP